MSRVRGSGGLTFVVSLVLAGAAVTAALADPPYAYYYFDQPIWLGLDTSRVAVLSDRPDARDQLAAGLSRAAGLRAEDTEHYAHDKWWAVPTAGGVRDAAAVEQLVSELAQDASTQFVSPVFTDARGLPLLVTRQILVRFRADVLPEQAEATIIAITGGRILATDFAGIGGLYLVEAGSRSGFDVLESANALAQLPDVLYAEPDKLQTGTTEIIPNDTFFARLWGIHNTGQNINNQGAGLNDFDMDGPEAWDVTRGSATIKVGILDLGIQQNHPDLNNEPGADFTGAGMVGGGPQTVCDNHGTAVAGCVAARFNNGLGVVGIAPECKVVSLKIGRADVCNGTYTGQDTWYAAALNYAVTNGLKVTNASLGFGQTATVTTAYQLARDAGLVHFASSGNDGQLGINYPASLSTVAAVGALTHVGTRASYSNYGPGLMFSAPGSNVYTTDRTGSSGYSSGDYAWVDGTSFASPYAAGVAALVASQYPSLGPLQIETIMQATCVDLGPAGPDTDFGYGFVNANNAVNYVFSLPGAFSPDSPANAATAVSVIGPLTWTPSSQADTYTVTIDTTPTFSSLNAQVFTGLTGTSLSLVGTPLVENTTYYWRVVASNFWGTTTASPASRSFTTFRDCDGNNVDDASELALNPALDCNGNGVLDACDLKTSYSARSVKLWPFGTGQPSPTISLYAPQDAAGTVSMTFTAVGDLNTGSEYVDVFVNATNVGRLYELNGLDCVPVTATLNVPAATWNAARGGGPVTLTLVPSPGVNPAPPGCVGAVYIQLDSLSHAAVPSSQDANNNGIPDECDVPSGCPGDVNCDGQVTFDDIDLFVEALGYAGGVGWPYPNCPWLNADCNGDNDVTFDDIDPFVALIGTNCP